MAKLSEKLVLGVVHVKKVLLELVHLLLVLVNGVKLLSSELVVRLHKLDVEQIGAQENEVLEDDMAVF
jgi:hypothetical protein